MEYYKGDYIKEDRGLYGIVVNVFRESGAFQAILVASPQDLSKNVGELLSIGIMKIYSESSNNIHVCNYIKSPLWRLMNETE
jgi:hypothetical protein